MKSFILTLSVWLFAYTFSPVKAQELASPNGKVVLSFSLTKEGTPSYKISYKNKSVIKESTLGFLLKKGESLNAHFKVVDSKRTTFKETWRPVWGEESDILNHYNELCVFLEQTTTHRKMNLRFRVYNEGVVSAMNFLSKRSSPTL